ncbi:MAG: hypothetical protein HC936_08985 [Leptolyngbyaceae cyanobacterium SU_3_3]|nr:hypothetical protein [Leptolyngbyaceae cyanobacterium SU_3_3]
MAKLVLQDCGAGWYWLPNNFQLSRIFCYRYTAVGRVGQWQLPRPSRWLPSGLEDTPLGATKTEASAPCKLPLASWPRQKSADY